MQDELEILRDVSMRLESAGIAFMLTGSVAMNYYAQPRMTRDIDLVVALDAANAEAFAQLFEPDYYLDRKAITGAIVRQSVFNLVHNESVIKVDCIVLKRDAYWQEEFERRQSITIGDFQTWIVNCEDLILSKLWWAVDSHSEMQIRDVINLLKTDCDRDYLQKRAAVLGVGELLDEVQKRNE